MPEVQIELEELNALRARLAESEELLRAIHAGEVDALVVNGPSGEQVYTLRSAEQPYRMLVEQMGQGAAILSADGDILYGNYWLAQLADTPLERIIGGSIMAFVDDDDRPAFMSLLTAGSGGLRGCWKPAHGPSFDVYMSLTTATSEDALRRNLIVTDLRALVDAQAGRDRAEQESHAKDEFMAMLAHELRNPLGAIGSAVQVLEAVNGDDSHAVHARAVIVRQVRHLSRLVEDLLDVGRVVTGKIALHRRPVDLAGLVRRSVAIFAERPSGLALEVATSPVWVNGDPVRLDQIITNVVGNAVKYTPSGGRIRVQLTAEDGRATLVVADTGVGVVPDLLPRIFDPFVQAEQTIDRAAGGLGIGLTLVRRLVELHGGTVSAASEGVGKGMAVTLLLPAIAAPEQKAEPPSPQPIRVKRRVLVIEDNDDARETLRVMLELAGHEVLEASDGRQGLDVLKASRPDIAIIDIGLPELNGYDLAEEYRAEPGSEDTLLIALTGYGLPEARGRSQRAGFDHHLVKPVSIEALWKLIDRPSDRGPASVAQGRDTSRRANRASAGTGS
jgi:signal transduction histidine kinase/FixJ family two-component response regulator